MGTGLSVGTPFHYRKIVARPAGRNQCRDTSDPVRPENPNDWAFTLDEGNVDPVLGYHFLSEAYLKADPDYKGRFTVPSVVDLQTGAVVNNDYFNLTRYWETEWKEFHKEGAPDLYPEELRTEIDELNDILFHEINNGVYKTGFARSQEAYEKTADWYFNDWSGWKKGCHTRDIFSETELPNRMYRLYVTLARFDIAYFNGFAANLKMLKGFPKSLGICKRFIPDTGLWQYDEF